MLSGLQHERIVCLLGACLAPPHICIVEELAPGGSLYDRLHRRSRSGRRGRQPPLPLPQACMLPLLLPQAAALHSSLQVLPSMLP